jgi:Xaa-Pro dipeptidase
MPRGNLPAECVISVELRIYFCRFIIKLYLKDSTLSKYIDKAVLDKYWDLGGARIEDSIHVTEDGYENLANTPKPYVGSALHDVGRHGMGDI